MEKAKQWALDLKPKLRGFSTDDVQNMVTGNAWIHHGWNGDVVNVRNQVDKPENYRSRSARRASRSAPTASRSPPTPSTRARR